MAVGAGEVWKGLQLLHRGYDAWQSAGAPLQSEAFIQKHSELLNASIDLVPEIDSLAPVGIDAGITSLLGHLASVVQAYHKKAATVSVNANYMLPRLPTADLAARAMFTTKDRHVDSFGYFLTLEQWADEGDACPTGVVLPVEKPDSVDALLMGAPRAFVFKKAQIVSDTQGLFEEIHEHENLVVRRALLDFFDSQKKRMRSFASFPLVVPTRVSHSCPHKVMAVVNIDSNRTRLLGFHAGNQRRLGAVLSPVLHILAHFLVRKHYRSNETQAAATSSLQ